MPYSNLKGWQVPRRCTKYLPPGETYGEASSPIAKPDLRVAPPRRRGGKVARWPRDEALSRALVGSPKVRTPARPYAMGGLFVPCRGVPLWLALQVGLPAPLSGYFKLLDQREEARSRRVQLVLKAGWLEAYSWALTRFPLIPFDFRLGDVPHRSMFDKRSFRFP